MLVGDFHCHTVFSRDACTGVRELVRRCERVGITCLAVTDHDEIEGARRVQAHAGFRVIVGEEIFAAEGEVIGLFLRERIAPGRSLRETMLRIKDQGGVVYLPHPVSGPRRRSQLAPETIEAHADLIDVVETYNGRTLGATAAQRAWLGDFVGRHGLATAAASDAHGRWEIGTVRSELPDFAGPDDFVGALRGAPVTCRPSPRWLRRVLNRRVRGVLRRLKGQGAR